MYTNISFVLTGIEVLWTLFFLFSPTSVVTLQFRNKLLSGLLDVLFSLLVVASLVVGVFALQNNEGWSALGVGVFSLLLLLGVFVLRRKKVRLIETNKEVYFHNIRMALVPLWGHFALDEKINLYQSRKRYEATKEQLSIE